MSTIPSSASRESLSEAFFNAEGVAIHRAMKDLGRALDMSSFALLYVAHTTGSTPPNIVPTHGFQVATASYQIPSLAHVATLARSGAQTSPAPVNLLATDHSAHPANIHNHVCHVNSPTPEAFESGFTQIFFCSKSAVHRADSWKRFPHA